jgi:WD40 repeat protein
MFQTAADPTLAHVAVEWEHSSPFVSCRFDPLGRYVFAGAEDMTVQRFALADGAKTPFAAHESWVRSMAFTDGGETLVTGGYDGRLIWWPAAAAEPKPIRTVEAHAGWLRALVTSPDGSLLASCGNDGKVRLWNAADGTLVRELVGHDRPVWSVEFHPSGQFLLSGDLLGVVRQWEVATGNVQRTFDAKDLHSFNGGQQVDFGGVRTIAVSADLKHVVCGGLHKAENPLGAVHDPLGLVFDWESGAAAHRFEPADVKGSAWRIQYHRDGYAIMTSGGSTGGLLLFFKNAESKEFHRFPLPALARDGDLHADGLQIATAHSDSKVRITRLVAKPA